MNKSDKTPFLLLVFLLSFGLGYPMADAGTSSARMVRTMKPFSSDQCTYFYQGPASRPDLWSHCCVEHDLFYWAGGTKKQRLTADRALKQCISEAGFPGIAELVYIGVRAGRLSPVSIENHVWGNGWQYSKQIYKKMRYRHLSEAQVELIESNLNSYDHVPSSMKERLMNSLIESRRGL